MRNKIIALVAVLCIVALFTVSAIATHIRNTVPENPTGTVGNTSGNLYNGGMFCENDGYVYFSNPYDNNALYRMRPDESDMERLITTQTGSINADSKYLYYYQSGSGSGSGFGFIISSSGVYRAEKNNPKNLTCLDRILGKYVVLADNTVYYTCSGDTLTLNKIDTDGENKEIFLDADILPASIQNSTFYYTNNKNDLHLMALDLNTGSARQILTEDIYMPIVEGSIVYGIDIHDNYSLIRINMTDGTKTVLDSSRTDILNVTDNYIYYQTSGDTPQLKRIYKDGSNMEVVADGVYNTIHATSEYVYFTGFGSTIPVYKTPVSGTVNVTTFDAAAAAALEALK